MLIHGLGCVSRVALQSYPVYLYEKDSTEELVKLIILLLLYPSVFHSSKKRHLNMSSSPSSSTSVDNLSPFIITISPISNIVSIKLTFDNYLLRKAQLVPYFLG